MDLIALLEYVLILCCIIAAVYAVVTWAPIPAPFKTVAICIVAICIVAIICIIFFFDLIRGGGGLSLAHLPR